MFAFLDGMKRFLINSNCYSAASCCSMQKCLTVMVTHYLLTVDSVKMVSLQAIDRVVAKVILNSQEVKARTCDPHEASEYKKNKHSNKSCSIKEHDVSGKTAHN